MLTENRTATAGLDAVALKPLECDVTRGLEVPHSAVVVDYEGPEAFPDPETLRTLAEGKDVRVTTPVRADGFDPLGDDGRLDAVPDGVERVFVAGNPAYLTADERTRAVAPRLRAVLERDPGAWVGTESVERVALAVGGTQFELLSRETAREVRALRAAGFDGEIAVYAPTVFAADDDDVLDALGGYVSRRRPVAAALPAEAPTDASATGRARQVLAAAARDYALVGTRAAVAEQVADLKEAGVDAVVGYPASGVEAFLER